MFLVTGEIIYFKAIDAREEAAHVRNPKSSYSSLIGISLPELSLAFPILKVAKMDVKVSHSCSDSVTLTPRKYNEYRPLHLQRAVRHKFYVVVRMDLNRKRRKVPPSESKRQHPVVVFELSIFVKDSFRFESKRFRIYTFVVCHGP
jgi:hypothetical protein